MAKEVEESCVSDLRRRARGMFREGVSFSTPLRAVSHMVSFHWSIIKRPMAKMPGSFYDTFPKDGIFNYFKDFQNVSQF